VGTSSSYNAPVKGDWTSLKRELTHLFGEQSEENVKKVVKKFIKALGGTENFSRSKQGSSSNNAISSAIGRKTASNLGGFFSGVSKNGLNNTLKENNLSHLVGKPLDGLIEGLIEYFSHPSNSADHYASSKAGADTLKEISLSCKTVEEFEQNNESFGKVSCIFISKYIYRLFLRMFEEDKIKKYGIEETSKIFKMVENYINAEVNSYRCEKDFSKVDFNTEEGKGLIQGILQDILEILEGGNDEN